MAELFHHTDEDGETLQVVGMGYLAGRPVVVNVGACGEADWAAGVYLDRDAALRLAAALVGYYGPEEEH